jgi:hypothetical protein
MWGVKLYPAPQREEWLLFPETSEKSLALLQIPCAASFLARIYAVDMGFANDQAVFVRRDIQEAIAQLLVTYLVTNVVVQVLRPVPLVGQEHCCLVEHVFVIKD